MKFTKQGIKWRQVVALSMIAVPWFLRDELAGRMEKRATDAQQVLTEKDQQQVQQQQISDQRDLIRRIGEIQAQLKLVDTKVDPNVSAEEIDAQARKSDDESLGSFFKDTGSDLAESADKLDELMEQVTLPSAEEGQLSGVSASVHKTAHDLESFAPDASESVIDAKFTELSTAQDDLVDAYEKLSNVAEQERVRSTHYANTARGVAWAFTAIGTALMGNWKKLLGGSDEEEEEAGKK